MVQYIPLPEYKASPLMDLSSLNKALDSRNQAAWKMAQMGEDTRRWESSNALAQGRLDIEKAQESRAASSAPLQQDLLRAQIDEARRNGATEAQITPLKLQMMKAQAGLYDAQASAARQKDELNTAISSMIRGAIPQSAAADQKAPPAVPSDNPVRPQSFDSGQAPSIDPTVMRAVVPETGVGTGALWNLPRPAGPNALNQTGTQGALPPATGRGNTVPAPIDPGGGASRDPNLVLTQGAETQPPQRAQPPSANMVRTPMGPMPMEQAQRLGFALGLAGKGDAGKIFVDAASQNQLGKKATGDVEDQLINRISDLSDLQNIKTQFEKNPQMLEVSSRLKATGLSWQAWLDSKSVSPEDKKFLVDYRRFVTATTERMNARIKAFSGSAVSGQEKVRMEAANPHEGDDPITFGAKLDEQINMQRAAIARYNWLKTQGLQPGQIKELAQSGGIEAYAGLDGMKGIYDKRGQEIEQELRQRQPNLQPQQYRELRNRLLNQEFGI